MGSLVSRLVGSKSSSSEIKECKPELTDIEKNKLLMNRVLVRVWTSKHYGGQYVGHVSVELLGYDGERGSYDKGSYISFWPYQPADGDAARAGVQFVNDASQGQRWAFMQQYIDDRVMEGRPPEHTFCMYTLSTSNIRTTFAALKTNPQIAWTLFGDYHPRRTTNSTPEEESKQSCVSLACMCLDSGGINELIGGVTNEMYISSMETSKMSGQSSVDTCKQLSLQPPSNASAFSAEEIALVTGFCVSPDVMVRRLQEAKKKEFKKNPNISLMERLALKDPVGNVIEVTKEWRFTNEAESEPTTNNDLNRRAPAIGRDPQDEKSTDQEQEPLLEPKTESPNPPESIATPDTQSSNLYT